MTGDPVMPAAVWTGDGVEVREVPYPVVPDGWSLVRVLRNGICGTDLAIVHGTHPRARPPLVLGHEIAGWVERAGAGGPAEGTLVAVEPLISCGRCRACREGHTHVCRELRLFGIDAPGGMASHVALPPDKLHPVPDGVAPEVAALCEPLAVAVHAVDRAGLTRGEVVAVYGAGPIGVLTALVARHAGAETVVVVEPNEQRRALAAQLGFTSVTGSDELLETLDGPTDGEGADVVFDSAAHPSVAAHVTAATRVLGRIIVVGVYKTPTTVDLQAVCFKEQQLLGVRVYTADNMQRAVALAASGDLGLERLAVRTFPLADATSALAAAASGQNCLKVLVDPTGSEPR